MLLTVLSNVCKTTAAMALTLGCLTLLGGCQTSRQAQQELEQENIALERRIQENYAFMQHQQRRINALEAQLPAGAGSGAPKSKPSSYRPAPTSSPAPLGSTRHSWVNPDSGVADEEPEAQPAGDFDSPLDQLNVDPNGEPSISVPNAPSQNVPKNLFRNGNGPQTNLQPAMPQMSLLPTVNVSDLAEISLDPEQIGPLQIDFENQEEGLRMVLNCRTKQGEFAVAVGQVTIVALDPTLPGEQARVARWDISPSQVERQIKQAPQPDGILFELAWPKEKPQGKALDVFVRMEDGQGARLQTRQQVQMDGILYALWTPPQEEALPMDDSVDAPVEQVAEMEALPQIESEPETVGEVQQGEISKSVIVVASPQVEALRDRTRTEIPPAMVLTDPQSSPNAANSANSAMTASTAVPGIPIGQNASTAAAPAASANPATTSAKPTTQTARPTWSPYR